jgi:methylenetetrahydrofolate dehydrogenase (NADP+)/methenyltetrahydrofolate cyclohydrolase
VTDAAQATPRPGDDAQVDVAAARLLHGAAIAKQMRARIKTEVGTFRKRHGFVPALAVVIVGKDAPSAVYLHQIIRSCRNVGVPGRVVELTGRATAAQLRRRIEELNTDPLVGGIIVQMPLPRTIPLRAVIDTIHPGKDIDGIHPLNAGLLTLGYQGFHPACAEAAVEILKRSGYSLPGKHAVVIGRSNVVGKPASLLLLRENCTVTVCHRKTRDLAGEVRQADVLVVGAGSPGLVTGEMLKPGVLVVDVGINVVNDKLVGDVDFESARQVAGALTPVPGGVGPVTNAVLLQHLMRAARTQLGEASQGKVRPTGRLALQPVGARS